LSTVSDGILVLPQKFCLTGLPTTPQTSGWTGTAGMAGAISLGRPGWLLHIEATRS